MNIMAPLESSVKDDFPYSTSIPKYSILEAIDDDWSKLNNFLRDVDWMSLLDSHSLDTVTDLLIETIETAVLVTCGSLSQEKKVEDSHGRSYRSNNLIPKEEHSLFKSKSKIRK